MVLGYQGSHFVAVSMQALATGALATPRTGLGPGNKLTGYFSREFGTHRRFATSAVPITSLQATADTGENITITYTDQNGRQFTIKLNAKHDLVSNP